MAETTIKSPPTSLEKPTAPLTALQQGMVYQWLRDPQGGVDVEQMVCTLHGGVSEESFRHAWERVLPDSGICRLAGGDEMTWEGVSQEWVRCDFSQHAEPETAFIKWLTEDRRLGFALREGDLSRVTWIVMPHDVRMVWSFHHLALDGRSLTSVLAEVFGAHEPAGPSPINYYYWLAGRQHGASEAYWREHLQGLQGATPLVINNTGAVDAGFTRREADAYLTDEQTLALKDYAATHRVTMNTLITGAWLLLMSRYSGESTVITGTTRACRYGAEGRFRETAALMINTVPLRADIEPSLAPIDFLKSLRATWIEQRAHEQTPLPLVRRWSGIGGTQPLFNHLVVYENEDYTRALHRLAPQSAPHTFELKELTSVPLTLQAYGGDRLRLHCAFDGAQFDSAFVERMLGHVAHVLGQFADGVERLADIVLTTPAERSQLLRDGAATTQYPSGDMLHSRFRIMAERYPNNIAVTGSDGAWTYAELDSKAEAVSAALQQKGVKRRDIVAICMERRAALLAGILGILKAGAAYLPIDTAYPAARLSFMLEDARAAVFLSEESLLSKLPPNDSAVLRYEDIDFAAQPTVAPVDVEAGDLAYIIYTSGSTGQPKGCMITHANAIRLMSGTEQWYGFGPSDVWTLFHSTAFDFSVWEIWGALLYGGRLVVVPWLTTRSPDDFYGLLCHEGVTVLNQTPSAFRQLIAAEDLVRSSECILPPVALRYVIFGGEALEMQSLQPWFDRHGDAQPQLVNMYGITETTVHVTYRALSRADLQQGSVIGVPIPDLSLYVLDPGNRQPVPCGVPGELYVGGAGLASGYLRRDELTADRFIPNHLTGEAKLYKTGDLARVLPGRDIEYLGRIDQQVKIRGFRIELGEIESVLHAHPEVQSAAVLARTEPSGVKRLCAWLVAPEKPSVESLRAHLLTKVPDYMVPAAFVFVEKFPLTANGKLDSTALPAPESEAVQAKSFRAPRDEREAALVAIWQDVLRVERVGVDDHFFELGGDSILSIHVISRARAAGYLITPRQIFDHPTVAGLAAVMQGGGSALTVSVPSEEPCTPFALSPIQDWFFQQWGESRTAHHWNQSFLFRLARPIKEEDLHRALTQVSHHHSALRLRFHKEEGKWQQTVSEETGFIISTHTVADVGQIEAISAAAQGALDFQQGPVLHAVLISAPDGQRLLLAVHHLVIDGVSWQILLEDLERALSGQAFPGASAPFSAWVRATEAWAQTASEERAYWANVLARWTPALPAPDVLAAQTERACQVYRVQLDALQTADLLTKATATHGVKIQDLLLTALALALRAKTGQNQVSLHVEGHGREAHLSGDLDLGRAIGWFTSIYPCNIELHGHPTTALKGVQAQLQAIPGRGAGFLACGLSHHAELVFNYLGQFDALTAHSTLFTMAAESPGPWHSPDAMRRYPVEINAMIIGGALEFSWTYAPQQYAPALIAELAAGCMAELKALTTSRPATEFPLSPMQKLFFTAAAARPGSGWDQWHGVISGPLDQEAFQHAWQEVVERHSILRTTFHDGTAQPYQRVHEGTAPEWVCSTAEGPPVEAMARILQQDTSRSSDLSQPLPVRFSLTALSDGQHFFLMTLPDLQLDGWSWPVIFGEASHLYTARVSGHACALPAVKPYSEYLHWASAQDTSRSLPFWAHYLADHQPVPVPGDLVPAARSARRFRRSTLHLSETESRTIQGAARQQGVSPAVLIQAAWALLLGHVGDCADIVFGSAFSGRPDGLEGADRIVGPFVNNLPVRLRLEPQMSVHTLLLTLAGEVFTLLPHQLSPLTEIQEAAGIPWNRRLFDTLVVFQNYRGGEEALKLGEAHLSAFTGPIHTAYPFTLVVTPGESWELLLVAQESMASAVHSENLLAELSRILGALVAGVATTAEVLKPTLLPAGMSRHHGQTGTRPAVRTAPRTELEKRIATLWQRAFGITDPSIEDNFFDLGGNSLLMVRLHHALRHELGLDLTLVDLFRFPSISALVRHLEPTPAGPSTSPTAVNDRAAAARAAANKQRDLRARS